MNTRIPRATYWARRAGLILLALAACIYTSFFFTPIPETETLTAAAAFWAMTTSYLTGGILLFTPTK